MNFKDISYILQISEAKFISIFKIVMYIVIEA